MSKFMVSVGLVLASLAGISGAVLGATPAGKAVNAREAKLVLTAVANRPDGPYYTKAAADADVNYRIGQGYTNVYETYDDAADFYYVYFS